MRRWFLVWWFPAAIILLGEVAVLAGFHSPDHVPLWAVIVQDEDQRHAVVRPERFTDPHACWVQAATMDAKDASNEYFCAEIP